MRDYEAVVAITNLSRKFGSKSALNDVSLNVPRGGVFGLVGENDAGKSTLMKHILGLWRAETGTVRVFGLDPVLRPKMTVILLGCPMVRLASSSRPVFHACLPSFTLGKEWC